MTPLGLRRRIGRFRARPPITASFERALEKRGTFSLATVWYKSQKEHWLGWLNEYSGPGYYGREDSKRSAEFVYNHINCPPMTLWLGEASGVPASRVRRAKRAALAKKRYDGAQCAAIREIVTWEEIEARLATSRQRK